MKKATLTLMILAAFGGVQASAAASGNLPEAQVGSGMGPDAVAPTTSLRAFQSFDLFEASDADDADEAQVDNMPEANVGDGTKAN